MFSVIKMEAKWLEKLSREKYYLNMVHENKMQPCYYVTLLFTLDHIFS